MAAGWRLFLFLTLLPSSHWCPRAYTRSLAPALSGWHCANLTRPPSSFATPHQALPPTALPNESSFSCSVSTCLFSVFHLDFCFLSLLMNTHKHRLIHKLVHRRLRKLSAVFLFLSEQMASLWMWLVHPLRRRFLILNPFQVGLNKLFPPSVFFFSFLLLLYSGKLSMKSPVTRGNHDANELY